MTMRFCTRLIPALLLLSACGGADEGSRETAAVSSGSSSPAPEGGAKTDAGELRDYRLNMEDVRKWVQAQKTMAAIERESTASAAADPDADAETEAEETEPVGDSQTLDGIQARVEGIPEFRKAVEAAGLGARDYALVTLAYMQAGMATAAVRMGADRDSLATAMQINPANVAFIEQNEAELTRLMKELEAEAGSQ